MKPISGHTMFNALKKTEAIIMACNIRIIAGVAKGIFKAAKETDSAIIFEIAKSESDLNGGYTGNTPEMYAKLITEANEVNHDIWALHADHIGIKKGTEDEMIKVKELVKHQIDAGFTSFAIDASHIFNFEGKNVLEELEGNIKATVELAKFIKENLNSFGLEVEVGEIGKEDESGRVLTKPEEAVTFIKKLNENNIFPDLLAIANGSAHGNTYDVEGNLIEQVTIDIPQTIAIGEALHKENLFIGIAQHGITGTPLNIVKENFPKKYLRKGNVGTHWQNLVWDILKEHEPELYKKIWNWTIKTHAKPGKSDIEIFGKNSKLAIKEFYDELYDLNKETLHIIEEKAYNDALKFIDAFNSKGTAEIVRKMM
jgi:fructose-bisphosphate aldolase, class II